MRYGETGVNLEIDLSRGNIEKVETDPRDMELYLGGQGTAAKILWDRVPPEVEPFSPDNILIFSTGLLNGTPVPGANRTAVNTFSPQTNLMAHSLMGGFFGPELKHAGYDKIVIRGKAPDLVYLYINNDIVEIRDATHLKGKGSAETGDLLKKELKDVKVQVAAIGPAGENRVYMASIDHGHSSAARGPGPVMGDKRLKAIAVRGTKDIYLARPAELFEICQRLHKKIADSMDVGDWMAVDEDDSFHHNNFAWGNARTRIKNYWSKELEDRWRKLKYDHMDRQTSCYNCPKTCRNVISWPGRRRFAYKCYGKDTYHMAAFQELDFTFDILGVAQDLGLDSYSTPQVIAFALELYEAGILADKDFPGMPSDTPGRFFYLLDKIAHREGIGDTLANGVYHAARQIGNGAEEYDHNTTKKFEQLPIKLGKLNPPYFLMIATAAKMAITQIEGSFPQDPIPDMEARKVFVEKWAPVVPHEKFIKYFMEWEKRNEISNQASCDITDWNEAMHFIDDSVGLCGFVSSFRGQFGGGVTYHVNNLPPILSFATGMELDKDGLWKIFQRNRNLVRAVNVRRGLRRIDEKPPEDHWAVRDHVFEQKLLDDYYDFKGWNNDGIPTKETLDKLGLGYVTEDFLQRGILTDQGNIPAQGSSAEKEKKSQGVVTVKGELKKKIVKEIKVDVDKCTGCRSCEMACSAFHAEPKYSIVNPARARIRVIMDEIKDEYVPIRAGDYTQAECNGRNIYTINGKEYSECSFCPASCPSRDYFKEPDTGLPLKCDMCEDNPPLPEPMCVQACEFDALIYVEKEEECFQEEEKPQEMEIIFESLVKKHGLNKVRDTFARLTKSKK